MDGKNLTVGSDDMNHDLPGNVAITPIPGAPFVDIPEPTGFFDVSTVLHPAQFLWEYHPVRHRRSRTRLADDFGCGRLFGMGLARHLPGTLQPKASLGI